MHKDDTCTSPLNGCAYTSYRHGYLWMSNWSPLYSLYRDVTIYYEEGDCKAASIDIDGIIRGCWKRLMFLKLMIYMSRHQRVNLGRRQVWREWYLYHVPLCIALKERRLIVTKGQCSSRDCHWKGGDDESYCQDRTWGREGAEIWRVFVLGGRTNSLSWARSKGNGIITDEVYTYNGPIIIST
jgi:hypothetical protein